MESAWYQIYMIAFNNTYAYTTTFEVFAMIIHKYVNIYIYVHNTSVNKVKGLAWAIL